MQIHGGSAQVQRPAATVSATRAGSSGREPLGGRSQACLQPGVGCSEPGRGRQHLAGDARHHGGRLAGMSPNT